MPHITMQKTAFHKVKSRLSLLYEIKPVIRLTVKSILANELKLEKTAGFHHPSELKRRPHVYLPSGEIVGYGILLIGYVCHPII